jgi:hypothetical protein
MTTNRTSDHLIRDMLEDDTTTHGTSDLIRGMLGDDITTHGMFDLIRGMLGDDITTNGTSDPIRDMVGDDIITNRTSDHPIGTVNSRPIALGGIPGDDITGGVSRPSHTVNSSHAKGSVREPFAPEEVKLVTEKREEGKTDKEISEILRKAGRNRSAASVCNWRARNAERKRLGKQCRSWAPQEFTLLKGLREKGLAWNKVATHFPGRTIQGLRMKYNGSRPGRSISRQPRYTLQEIALLKKLRTEKLSWKEISLAFPNRSIPSLKTKFYEEEEGGGYNEEVDKVI